jgi:cathepsin B
LYVEIIPLVRHKKLLYILACCVLCGGGCDGGFPTAAWRHYEVTGLVTGGNYNSMQGCEPYTLPSCDHQYVQKS